MSRTELFSTVCRHASEKPLCYRGTIIVGLTAALAFLDEFHDCCCFAQVIAAGRHDAVVPRQDGMLMVDYECLDLADECY